MEPVVELTLQSSYRRVVISGGPVLLDGKEIGTITRIIQLGPSKVRVYFFMFRTINLQHYKVTYSYGYISSNCSKLKCQLKEKPWWQYSTVKKVYPKVM
jgi:hypothetical protein